MTQLLLWCILEASDRVWGERERFYGASFTRMTCGCSALPSTHNASFLFLRLSTLTIVSVAVSPCPPNDRRDDYDLMMTKFNISSSRIKYFSGDSGLLAGIHRNVWIENVKWNARFGVGEDVWWQFNVIEENRKIFGSTRGLRWNINWLAHSGETVNWVTH